MADETKRWEARENELIPRAQMGDRGAYADLVCEHQRGVINVVYRMCGDAQLAEDAAQEAFSRAWNRLPGYRPAAPFRSWLYRIAINAALDSLRRQKFEMAFDMEQFENGDTPESLLAQKETAEQVRRAVLSLPVASRSVLVLREYEGLSYREIAEALDIPVGTVMSRLNSARNTLRSLLRDGVSKKEMRHA